MSINNLQLLLLVASFNLAFILTFKLIDLFIYSIETVTQCVCPTETKLPSITKLLPVIDCVSQIAFQLGQAYLGPMNQYSRSKAKFAILIVTTFHLAFFLHPLQLSWPNYTDSLFKLTYKSTTKITRQPSSVCQLTALTFNLRQAGENSAELFTSQLINSKN